MDINEGIFSMFTDSALSTAENALQRGFATESVHVCVAKDGRAVQSLLPLSERLPDELFDALAAAEAKYKKKQAQQGKKRLREADRLLIDAGFDAPFVPHLVGPSSRPEPRLSPLEAVAFALPELADQSAASVGPLFSPVPNVGHGTPSVLRSVRAQEPLHGLAGSGAGHGTGGLGVLLPDSIDHGRAGGHISGNDMAAREAMELGADASAHVTAAVVEGAREARSESIDRHGPGAGQDDDQADIIDDVDDDDGMGNHGDDDDVEFVGESGPAGPSQRQGPGSGHKRDGLSQAAQVRLSMSFGSQSGLHSFLMPLGMGKSRPSLSRVKAALPTFEEDPAVAARKKARREAALKEAKDKEDEQARATAEQRKRAEAIAAAFAQANPTHGEGRAGGSGTGYLSAPPANAGSSGQGWASATTVTGGAQSASSSAVSSSSSSSSALPAPGPPKDGLLFHQFGSQCPGLRARVNQVHALAPAQRKHGSFVLLVWPVDEVEDEEVRRQASATGAGSSSGSDDCIPGWAGGRAAWLAARWLSRACSLPIVVVRIGEDPHADSALDMALQHAGCVVARVQAGTPAEIGPLLQPLLPAATAGASGSATGNPQAHYVLMVERPSSAESGLLWAMLRPSEAGAGVGAMSSAPSLRCPLWTVAHADLAVAPRTMKALLHDRLAGKGSANADGHVTSLVGLLCSQPDIQCLHAGSHGSSAANGKATAAPFPPLQDVISVTLQYAASKGGLPLHDSPRPLGRAPGASTESVAVAAIQQGLHACPGITLLRTEQVQTPASPDRASEPASREDAPAASPTAVHTHRSMAQSMDQSMQDTQDMAAGGAAVQGAQASASVSVPRPPPLTALQELFTLVQRQRQSFSSAHGQPEHASEASGQCGHSSHTSATVQAGQSNAEGTVVAGFSAPSAHPPARLLLLCLREWVRFSLWRAADEHTRASASSGSVDHEFDMVHEAARAVDKALEGCALSSTSYDVTVPALEAVTGLATGEAAWDGNMARLRALVNNEGPGMVDDAAALLPLLQASRAVGWWIGCASLPDPGVVDGPVPSVWEPVQEGTVMVLTAMGGDNGEQGQEQDSMDEEAAQEAQARHTASCRRVLDVLPRVLGMTPSEAAWAISMAVAIGVHGAWTA